MLGMELDDEALLLGGEGSLLEVRSEVVGPPEAAALPAPGKARVLLHGVPVALSVLLHILNQDRVLGCRPRSLLQRRFGHADAATSASSRV